MTRWCYAQDDTLVLRPQADTLVLCSQADTLEDVKSLSRYKIRFNVLVKILSRGILNL